MFIINTTHLFIMNSNIALIANVLVFLLLVGFTIFVDVITIQYVDDVSRQCKNQDATRGEIIKVVAIISIVASGLIILLNAAAIFQAMGQKGKK